MGWSIKHDGDTNAWHYDIQFRRLEPESPMSAVLARPLEEEVDDYKEYKRLRHTIQLQQNPFHRAKPLAVVATDTATVTYTSMGKKTVCYVETTDDLAIPTVKPTLDREETPSVAVPIQNPALVYRSPFPSSPRASEKKTKMVGSVPMQASVKQALDKMRKQSIDEIAPFAWDR